MINSIFVGIPIHGYSDKLLSALTALLSSLDNSCVASYSIVLANSNSSKPALPSLSIEGLKEIYVPDSFYWSKSVNALYLYYQSLDLDIPFC